MSLFKSLYNSLVQCPTEKKIQYVPSYGDSYAVFCTNILLLFIMRP